VIDPEHAVVDTTATVAPTAQVGTAYRPLLDGRRGGTGDKAEIGRGAWIGDFCSVGRGVTIGDYSIIQEYSAIEDGARIGSHVLIRQRTNICGGVQIGDHCIVYGHFAEGVTIGSNCRVFGQFIHQQLDPTKGWDDPGSEEPSAVVRDGAFVGWNAIVIGPVVIAENSYVCAGAIVTRDVPRGHIAYGRNQIVPYADWPGALSRSPFFSPEAVR
jgi:bifunctional N-acetylglucosamine-1-phosphate-uridyltransferase/glucosamine-1-phosphate-acetyltransferase GlmU-like protein